MKDDIQKELDKAREKYKIDSDSKNGIYKGLKIQGSIGFIKSHYESAIKKLTDKNKEMELKINGAECGYGSLMEQGYWKGCEHAGSHYKPIIKKQDNKIKELESLNSAINKGNEKALTEALIKIDELDKKNKELKKEKSDILDKVEKQIIIYFTNKYMGISNVEYPEELIKAIRNI
jgi:hypothetical protein